MRNDLFPRQVRLPPQPSRSSFVTAKARKTAPVYPLSKYQHSTALFFLPQVSPSLRISIGPHPPCDPDKIRQRAGSLHATVIKGTSNAQTASAIADRSNLCTEKHHRRSQNSPVAHSRLHRRPSPTCRTPRSTTYSLGLTQAS